MPAGLELVALRSSMAAGLPIVARWAFAIPRCSVVGMVPDGHLRVWQIGTASVVVASTLPAVLAHLHLQYSSRGWEYRCRTRLHLALVVLLATALAVVDATSSEATNHSPFPVALVLEGGGAHRARAPRPVAPAAHLLVEPSLQHQFPVGNSVLFQRCLDDRRPQYQPPLEDSVLQAHYSS
jgi:hypothetical protein